MEKENLINKYFAGTLTKEEQVTFDKLLAQDANFQEQLRFEEDVKAVVQSEQRQQLKQKLQKIENQLESTKPVKKSYWKPLSIAASILLLFSASWFLYNSISPKSAEELYAANYEVYPNTVYTITRGDSQDDSLERQAFEAYEQNDLTSAIELFEELNAKSGLDYVEFYLGQVYMANNNVEKALDLFEKIITEESDFQIEALWYAALCQLKLDKPDKAIPLLKQLVVDGSYKKEISTELLNELE